MFAKSPAYKHLYVVRPFAKRYLFGFWLATNLSRLGPWDFFPSPPVLPEDLQQGALDATRPFSGRSDGIPLSSRHARTRNKRVAVVSSHAKQHGLTTYRG